MSMCLSFGVYNNEKKLLKSFDCYDSALQFVKDCKNVSYLDVLYLFDSKPTKVVVTKILYIQRYLESGGGVYPSGKKYYFNKDKF